MSASPEMKKLSFLEGTWIGISTYLPSAWTPAEVKKSCKRIYIPRLKGRILLSQYEETGDDTGTQAVEVLTWDKDLRCYRSLWFDTKGGVTDARGDFTGENKVELHFQTPEYEGRLSFTLVNPNEFLIDMDVRKDGDDWKPVLECRLQRAKKT